MHTHVHTTATHSPAAHTHHPQNSHTQTKAEMMQTWQTIFKENYHKSLDHRSFYFKQAEKKNLTRAFPMRGGVLDCWLAGSRRSASWWPSAGGWEVQLGPPPSHPLSNSFNPQCHLLLQPRACWQT